MNRFGFSCRAPDQAAISNSLCRQFLNGTCRYGTRCLYLHEWSVAPSAIPCRYFQKGGCWYGERCRYLHVLQSDGSAAATGRSSAAAVQPSLVGNVIRGSQPILPQIPEVPSQEPVHSQVQGIPHQGPFLPRFQGIPRQEPVLPRVHGIPRHGPIRPRVQGVPVEGSEVAWVNVSNLRRNLGHQTTDASQGPRLPQQEAETNLTALQESVQRPGMALAGTFCGASESSKESTEACGAAAASSTVRNETQASIQSRDVTCGICMDLVYEKTHAHERRFGILPNCNHSFCLGCIVTWRKTKTFEEEVVKACPQCRVKSAFYVPSDCWVEGQAKETLIAAFKEKSKKITCNLYMRFGRCPFKSECIYRHVTPRRRPRRNSSFDEEDLDVLQLLDCIMALTLLNDFDSDDDDDNDDDYFIHHLYLP